MLKNRKSKIFIIGSGQLGSACLRIARTRVPNCEVKLMNRAELDLTWSEGDIQDALILGSRRVGPVKGDMPDVIVNCAAYNDVDGAESNYTAAHDVNHAGVRKLAQFCKGRAVETLLIHFSTDYVFDGTDPGPDGYEEFLQFCSPVNVYGRSKLAGDKAVVELLSPHLPYYILRTSSLWSDPIGPHKSFASTVIQRLRSGETMKVRSNQFMKPTHVLDLAEAVMVLINMYENVNEAEYGLYNFACSGATSWHGFATAIGETAFKTDMARLIEPVSEYDTAAVRPKDTRLDCSRWVQATGLTPRHWMATMEHVGRFVLENADVQAR